MDRVYRHSACTIAALPARTSHDGFFVERNPLCYRTCDLSAVTEYPLRIRGRHYRKVVTRPGRGESGTSYLANPHGDDGAVRAGSTLRLRRRGWVFQEDLLARRTLYFGTDGVFWECLEQKRDEAHDVADTVNGRTGCVWCHRDATGTLKHQFHRMEAVVGDIGREVGIQGAYFADFHRWWWALLEEYSQLDLTQPGDKLVAVNGLVKAVVTASEGRLSNVAGHWREHLPFDLLWATGDGSAMERGDTCTRSPESRAPSWSWAAVDGPIRFI